MIPVQMSEIWKENSAISVIAAVIKCDGCPGGKNCRISAFKRFVDKTPINNLGKDGLKNLASQAGLTPFKMQTNDIVFLCNPDCKSPTGGEVKIYIERNQIE